MSQPEREAPESRVIVMDLLPAQEDVIAFIKAPLTLNRFRLPLNS